jgi:hypothetical protein
MNKKFNHKSIAIGFSIFFIVIFIFSIVYGQKQSSERENDKNLVGYTVQNEKLVDSCNLVNVEGFYLGKGVLNGQVHYIFQGQKNNEKSNNIDVIDKLIEIIYVTSSDTTDKPGTVKAYTKNYVKKDKDGKVIKSQQRYFYKVYIPQNSIKDCGELTKSSDDSSSSDE